MAMMAKGAAKGARNGKVVAYYRVSTVKQGQSGLGLDGQRSAVDSYSTSNNLDIIGSYREVESGKRADRPELAKAMAHAKRAKALLVFAKLDRLSRDAHALLGIVKVMDRSGADCVFCDFPNIPAGPMGRYMLTNMAAVAELEAGLISVRTKDALRAFREGKMIPKRFRDPKLYPNGPPPEAEAYRGLLGSHRPGARRLKGGANPKAARAAGEAARELKESAYHDIAPIVAELRAEGLTLRKIAARLTEEGKQTRHGHAFNHVQVKRILDDLKRAERKAG